MELNIFHPIIEMEIPFEEMNQELQLRIAYHFIISPEVIADYKPMISPNFVHGSVFKNYSIKFCKPIFISSLTFNDNINGEHIVAHEDLFPINNSHSSIVMNMFLKEHKKP